MVHLSLFLFFIFYNFFPYHIYSIQGNVIISDRICLILLSHISYYIQHVYIKWIKLKWSCYNVSKPKYVVRRNHQVILLRHMAGYWYALLDSNYNLKLEIPGGLIFISMCKYIVCCQKCHHWLRLYCQSVNVMCKFRSVQIALRIFFIYVARQNISYTFWICKNWNLNFITDLFLIPYPSNTYVKIF